MCARLRNISVSTVQMIQSLRRLVEGDRRQISPLPFGESGTFRSLFGYEHACTHASDVFRDVPRAAAQCGRCQDLGAGYSSQSLTATLANEPGVTGDAHDMHACNHTKKFLSYKSHFAMDAKYLIMANTEMSVGKWKCDGAEPVAAAINQRG